MNKLQDTAEDAEPHVKAGEHASVEASVESDITGKQPWRPAVAG